MVCDIRWHNSPQNESRKNRSFVAGDWCQCDHPFQPKLFLESGLRSPCHDRKLSSSQLQPLQSLTSSLKRLQEMKIKFQGSQSPKCPKSPKFLGCESPMQLFYSVFQTKQMLRMPQHWTWCIWSLIDEVWRTVWGEVKWWPKSVYLLSCHQARVPANFLQDRWPKVHDDFGHSKNRRQSTWMNPIPINWFLSAPLEAGCEVSGPWRGRVVRVNACKNTDLRHHKCF